MDLQLHQAPGPAWPHRIRLGHPLEPGTLPHELLEGLPEDVPVGPVELDAGEWSLTLTDWEGLRNLLNQRGLQLERARSSRPETLVSAAALGISTALCLVNAEGRHETVDRPNPVVSRQRLLVHRGTLRSGDHISHGGSLLVLGDVNPGAHARAGGDILVWGRLRGFAHAGADGWGEARIAALQLRPQQLRIAGHVALGPEGAPEAGMAEEAHLCSGVISIRPASSLAPVMGPGERLFA
ncbi:MAG: septum site-determining protein MinC [Aphanocapsa feldmannii 288cV]|nr:MAG: septum site-determining protein MinC [Aphanocapsa feldmannii 288cV]